MKSSEKSVVTISHRLIVQRTAEAVRDFVIVAALDMIFARFNTGVDRYGFHAAPSNFNSDVFTASPPR